MTPYSPGSMTPQPIVDAYFALSFALGGSNTPTDSEDVQHGLLPGSRIEIVESMVGKAIQSLTIEDPLIVSWLASEQGVEDRNFLQSCLKRVPGFREGLNRAAQLVVQTIEQGPEHDFLLG